MFQLFQRPTCPLLRDSSVKEHINEWVEEAIRIRNQYPK